MHYLDMAQQLLDRTTLKLKSGLIILVLINVGCSGEAPAANAAAEGGKDQNAEIPALSDRKPEQQNSAAEPDISDQMSLKTAETACKNGDPNAFFDAFIQSKAVQKKYTAASVEKVQLQSDFTVNHWEEVKANDYTAFPIKMADYYRKSTQPIREGDDEHVIIELNQGQNEAFVVEWTRVTYDGKSLGEGDDLGTAYTLDGKPYKSGESMTDGQLLFEAAGYCWNFALDTRHYRNGASK